MIQKMRRSSERNALRGASLKNEVFNRRLRGNTYEEISDTTGLTRARIGQIVSELKQSVSPKTAANLGEKKQRTMAIPRDYRSAQRLNQVMVLATKGVKTKKIAETLHVAQSTVQRDIQKLKQSLSTKTFQSLFARGRRLRPLSAVEEHIRSKHIMPLIQRYFYHFVKKYQLGPTIREESALLLELESHFMAIRLKPHPHPECGELVTKRWVYLVVRGIFLNELRIELNTKLGIKQTEARKLQSMLGALSRGKPVEAICAERNIPLAEAKELLEIYQHYRQISIEEFQDRI